MVSQSIPTVGQLTAQTVCCVDANRRNMGQRSPDETFERALAKAVERGFVAAFRWLGNGDTAREACQEAAAKTLKARGSCEPGDRRSLSGSRRRPIQ